MPQNSKISTGKTKENLQLFSDYRAHWAKELQWENDNALKESQESAYYWQYLLVRIGWSNLMSIYIKKSIAKA